MTNSLRKRVAILAPGEVFGGAERQILAVAGGLRKNKFADPYVVVFHDREFAQRARDLGLPVSALCTRSDSSLLAARDLRHLLVGMGVEVVLVHGYRATVCLSLAARGLGISVIKTEHGLPETYGLTLVESAKRRLVRRLEVFCERLLNVHVVYVTQELRRACERQRGAHRWSVIYNGIDAIDEATLHRPREMPSSGTVALCLGRLERVKGLDSAIRAMIDPEMPIGTTLLLVGAGPEEDSLRALAAKLGIQARVHFVGHSREAHSFIKFADALLMPSIHEGLPYSMLEAMYLGTPIVASRVGGIAEVHCHGESALLFEAGRPDQIAASIQLLSQSPDLRRRLASQSIAMVKERFVASRMVSEYERLMSSMQHELDT